MPRPLILQPDDAGRFATIYAEKDAIAAAASELKKRTKILEEGAKHFIGYINVKYNVHPSECVHVVETKGEPTQLIIVTLDEHRERNAARNIDKLMSIILGDAH